jgi:CoA binding domain
MGHALIQTIITVSNLWSEQAGERGSEGSGMTDAPGPSASSAASSPAEALAALEAAARVLAETRSVLVIDWPSRDVPVSLAFAGFTVFVKGGPGPADYNVWQLDGGEPVSRPLGGEPGRVDMVYCHRPFGELPGIIALAGRLGARALWWQTGLASDGSRNPSGCWAPPEESRQARELAGAAGLAYVDDVYLADAVRALTGPPGHQGS